jgi:protein subunit release factor B
MSIFKVSSRKEQALLQRMKELNVCEDDIEETFIRASGPGGQKTNKTSSCVSLRHIPTNTIVKCQQERSQALNRFLARRQLLDQIERMQKGVVKEEALRIEKIRNRKRKTAKRAKKKIFASKTRQSDAKENNNSPENVIDSDS